MGRKKAKAPRKMQTNSADDPLTDLAHGSRPLTEKPSDLPAPASSTHQATSASVDTSAPQPPPTQADFGDTSAPEPAAITSNSSESGVNRPASAKERVRPATATSSTSTKKPSSTPAIDEIAAGPSPLKATLAFREALTRQDVTDGTDAYMFEHPDKIDIPHILLPPLSLLVPAAIDPVLCTELNSFNSFKEFYDPWAILGLPVSNGLPEPGAVAEATANARRRNKLDDGASKEAREWHTLHEQRIRQAGSFLNRDEKFHGSFRTEQTWHTDIEQALVTRKHFQNLANEYKGRTLRYPPVGVGRTVTTIRCPDLSCATCDGRAVEPLTAQDYPEFKDATERGAAVGLFKKDPAAAMRIVYASMNSRGEIRFRAGRYTIQNGVAPTVSADSTIPRTDIAPFDTFPHLVSTMPECEAVYQTLSANRTLPPNVSTLESFMTRISSKSRVAMKQHRQAYRDAIALLCPFTPTGVDEETMVPTFASVPKVIPLGLGGVDSNGRKYVLKVTITVPETFDASSTECKALELSRPPSLEITGRQGTSILLDSLPTEEREQNFKAQRVAEQNTQAACGYLEDDVSGTPQDTSPTSDSPLRTPPYKSYGTQLADRQEEDEEVASSASASPSRHRYSSSKRARDEEYEGRQTKKTRLP